MDIDEYFYCCTAFHLIFAVSLKKPISVHLVLPLALTLLNHDLFPLTIPEKFPLVLAEVCPIPEEDLAEPDPASTLIHAHFLTAEAGGSHVEGVV